MTTKSFDGAVRSVDGSVSGLGSRIGSFASGATVALGAVFAVDRVVDWGGSLLTAGNQLEVWRAKSETVFGDQIDQVREWADANNEALGLTDEQLTGLAANTGDLLKPMGFTSAQAADLSTEMLGLAGALSAWSGGTRSAAEVSEIFTDAMLGETDALKGLGIDISAAAVQARVAANGQSELTGEALRQAEAMATLQLIQESSTDAQKAWADGSLDAIKQQNELTATWAEGKEALASALMPAFQAGTRFLANDVVPAMRSAITLFQEEGFGGALRVGAQKIADAWPAMRAALIDFGRQVIDWIVEYAPVVAEQLFEWGKALVEWAVDAIPPLLEALGDGIEKVGGWFADDGLTVIVTKAAEWGKALIEWVGPMIPPLLLELGKFLAGLIEWAVTDLLPGVAAQMLKLSAKFWEWVGTEAVPKLLIELGGLLASLGRWVITSAVPNMLQAGIDLGVAMVLGFVDMAKKVGEWILDLPNKLIQWAGQIAGALFDAGATIGAHIGQGVANGMISSIPGVEAGADFINNISPGGGQLDAGRYLTGDKAASKHTGGTITRMDLGGRNEGLVRVLAGEQIIRPGQPAAGGGVAHITIALDSRVIADQLVDLSELAGGIPLVIRTGRG